MDARFLRFLLTLLCGLTLVTASAAAQDGGTAGGEGSMTEPEGQTTAAEPAPAPPSTSATTTAPGDGFAEAPVIHEPVGTTSDTNQSATPPAAPAEEENDGRDADLLWLELGFGYSWVDLAAFSQNNFVPGVDQIEGSGYAGHAAVGFKVFLFTLGARGTVGSYPKDVGSFDIWSLMFDAMLRIPIFFLEPYVRAGIGYAWMGSLNHEDLGNSSVSVYGLTIEAGAGIDFYLGKYISLGAGFDIAFLNLTRQRIDTCDSVGGAMCNVGGVDFQEEGDAAGFQLRATGHAALHF